jgi:hypothetical protein
MRKFFSAAAPLVVMLALGVSGCASEGDTSGPVTKSPDVPAKDPSKAPAGPSSGAPTPATPTATTINPKPQSPDAAAKDITKTPAAEMATMKYKDATHVLKTDSPYFTSMPSSDTKPDGKWKAGTQVLVLVPGAPYSEVKNAAGTDVYVPTTNLASLSK